MRHFVGFLPGSAGACSATYSISAHLPLPREEYSPYRRISWILFGGMCCTNSRMNSAPSPALSTLWKAWAQDVAFGESPGIILTFSPKYRLYFVCHRILPCIGS